MCFPNDLEIEIKASLSGSYEYKVNTDNITYVSCDNDDFDRTSPYIILSKGDVINKNNEVIDYVEIDQNGIYTVPLAYAYDQNGALITDSSAFNATLYYKDENSSDFIKKDTYQNSNGSITFDIDDIKNYKRTYKIEYSVNYDNKEIKAIRNIILQDTTAPVITIKKTEDVILYYSDSGVQTINYIFSQADVNDNSSSTTCVQGDSGECFYSVDGVEDINSYFNSDEFRAISQSDYATFSKLFPVIIIATDASGNISKKSQNITFTLKEAKEPNLKLFNATGTVIYDTSDSSITFEDTWRSDDKFTVKVESGCAIDDSNSYYIYDGNTTYFNTLGLSSKFDISFDITLEEGQKDLEVYATCGSDVDTSLFTVTNASIPTTTVKVDRSAPQCIIDVDGTYNSDTGWYTSKPTITYTLSDTNGVSGTFNNNGITNNIDSTTNYSQSITITEDGSYAYTLEGTDVAGKECSDTKSINVDTEDPTITFTKQVGYPTRNKFSTKVFASAGGDIGKILDIKVYKSGSILSYSNVSSINVTHQSSSDLGDALGIYNSGRTGLQARGCQYFTVKSGYDFCFTSGGRSAININLDSQYAISQWNISLYDVYGYGYSFNTTKSTGAETTTFTATGSSSSTKYCSTSSCSSKGVVNVSFRESSVTNLSLIYSDTNSGLNTGSRISAINNITANRTVSATDNAGNTATCTYNYSASTCSCTQGTCSVN